MGVECEHQARRHRRRRWPLRAALTVWVSLAGIAWGEEPTSTQPVSQSIAADDKGPGVQKRKSEAAHREERDWFAPSKAAATKHESHPPGYVRTLDAHGVRLGLARLEALNWLEIGIEQRTRFERRDGFYRADLETDDRFLMRTRVYLGVREILDPFRFGFEFQDSRRLGSELEENTGDINEIDFLQAFGELYFRDAMGGGQPLCLKVGRMSIDAVDRRLVARNRFRNTTNSFDGARAQIGEKRSPWELDLFAVQPVERRLRSLDRPDEERWLYGVAGYWRQWSPGLVLEPYYLILDEDRKADDEPDREIHTLGLHGYGSIGRTGFDYDFDVAFQLGENGDHDHRAFASHAEVGYTVSHAWKPRVAVWVNYASGDRGPDDGVTERFDRLFGASHTMYGYSDLFSWQNMINPAIHLSVRPTEKLRFDAFYRAYWLASDNDAFIRASRVDPAGNSGDFVGQEIDLRFRYELNRHLGLEMGYAHFFPGSFVESTGSPTDDSDFFYVQTTMRF